MDGRRPGAGRWLLPLVALHVGASIVHYVDNVRAWHHYPEPGWLSPALTDGFWFVLTPLAVAGLLLARRGRRRWAYPCLYAHGLGGLLVLGHYLVTPIARVSWRANATILPEALAAALLLGYLAWQHTRPPGRRAAEEG